MEKRSQPIGFLIKQINNVYEKDLNERLKKIGITSSQCAVLDYLFRTSKEEVSQRDVEKNLSLKNPDCDRNPETAGRKRLYSLRAECA